MSGGEAVTSGPRPLTWNLGKLNPAKNGGRVTSLPLKGEGQAEEVSEKAGNHQESNWLKVASYQTVLIKP